MDTVAVTMQLTHHLIARIFEVVDTIAPYQRHTTVNKCGKVMGELPSMVLATPGDKGLCIVLQEVLQNKCDQGLWVHLNVTVREMIFDFQSGSHQSAHHPRHPRCFR
jgi:hypothetical protein